MGAPGVFYKQRDLSQVVVGSDSSILGIAGNAKWGPVDELTLLDGLDKFVQMFGKPVSPTETPLFYQLLGWFKLGKSVWVVRPQGNSKYGGVEALQAAEVAGITASLDDIPTTPSGSNVIGIYTKYPGVHNEGNIYVNIFDVDNTAGTFSIACGVALDTGGTALDTGDEWYEEHAVSVISTAKDGQGRSMYIQDVLDRDSQLITGVAIADAGVDDVPIDSTSLVALAQNSYTAATDAEISLAYDLFKPLDSVTIDIVAPGNFSTTVLNKVAEVAVERGDCFYIVSPDLSETWTIDGISGNTGWKSNLTPLSWQGAAYAMKYKVKDEYNDRDVIVQAAGFIAGAYAYNDAVAEVWYAPAGPRRGIQLSVDTDQIWTKAEQDTLYDRGLNFVKKSPRYGITIEGQKTLYGVNSALNRVNVARLILKIKRDALAFLQDYVYEFNDSRNRALIKSGLDSYLREIASKDGLYDYRVICDDSNNPPSVIDQNKLYVDILLKPVKVAEFITLRSTITATGVDFDSLIST